MEFYELIDKITNAIPPGYENIRSVFETLLPWLFGLFTAATCLFGHAVHKIWNAFLFFCIGFFLPMLIIQGLFAPTGAVFWICAALSAVLGGICAYFSKKIYKAYLFISTFFLVFISVSSYLSFLGDYGSVAAGFVLAVAAAILSTKYKYITVIVTTAFSGSFMLFNIVENKLSIPHTAATALAVLFAFVGMATQCFVERSELKETYEHLKERKKQLSSVSKKIGKKSDKSQNGELDKMQNADDEI